MLGFLRDLSLSSPCPNSPRPMGIRAERTSMMFRIMYIDDWGGVTPVFDENRKEVQVAADSTADALDKFFAECDIPYEDMDAMCAMPA